MKQNTLGEDIPIVVFLKALGIESDAEIVSLIAGTDGRIASLLTPSFQEIHEMDIYTCEQAHVLIGTRIKNMKAICKA